MAWLLLRGCAALLLAARAAAQPAFLAGSPALAQLGAGGCVLSVALSGPAKLFYLVLPAAAPPPLLSDVLATTGRPLSQEVSRCVSRDLILTVSLTQLRSSAVAAFFGHASQLQRGCVAGLQGRQRGAEVRTSALVPRAVVRGSL